MFTTWLFLDELELSQPNNSLRHALGSEWFKEVGHYMFYGCWVSLEVHWALRVSSFMDNPLRMCPKEVECPWNMAHFHGFGASLARPWHILRRWMQLPNWWWMSVGLRVHLKLEGEASHPRLGERVKTSILYKEIASWVESIQY